MALKIPNQPQLYDFLCFWRLVRRHYVHRIFFAKSHAALRTQSSCREISSDVLSSNLGAQGFRSWVSPFWIIPRDDPFLSRMRISYQKCPENFTACPVEAFPLTCPACRRIDFFGSEFWDTQPWIFVCFRIATKYSLSSTSCCGSPHHQHVHKCIGFQTCNYDPREGVENHMTIFFILLPTRREFWLQSQVWPLDSLSSSRQSVSSP